MILFTLAPKRNLNISSEYIEYRALLAKQVGSRVRQRREFLGLTQEELRAKLQFESVYITRTQFSRIERGHRLPDAIESLALATVLHVSIDWLIKGSEEDDSK
jgi:transcriptional regulator with XRE-family HTH domain